MRWALVKVCVAVTTMVVVAFAVPLGLVIKELARDRAFSNAERQAAAVAPALSITTDRDQLERVVASAGSDDGMAVHIPASDDAKAVDIGRGAPPPGTSRPPARWAAHPPARSPAVPCCSSPPR